MASVLSVSKVIGLELEISEDGHVFVFFERRNKSYLTARTRDAGPGLLCFRKKAEAEEYKETLYVSLSLEVIGLEFEEARKLARARGLKALFLVEDDPDCPRIIWVD